MITKTLKIHKAHIILMKTQSWETFKWSECASVMWNT